MKKNLLNTVLLTILMSMVGTKAFSYSIAVTNSDGVKIYYDWINNKTELSVTNSGSHWEYGYSGDVRVPNSSYSGNVDIPAIVEYEGNTYVVTSIGASAFYKCSGLTSVTIPNNVTSIGVAAFQNCSGLTSLAIPSNVTSIGQYAFDGTAWYQNQSDGLIYAGRVAYKYKGEMPVNTSISIYEGTSEITGYAFYNCSNLTSITIPNSVNSIGSDAFYGCSGLTSVIIPNSVTSIGIYAFGNCSGLTSVSIGNSVTSIDYVFHNCSSLTSVSIGNSVTSIGTWAFKGCYGLTSVTIPNSVTSIGYSAFSGCSGLTSVIIPNSVTSIDSNAFEGCSGLTSLTIPNSVTSIGSNAFMNCTELCTVTVQCNLETSNDIYYGCQKLKEMIFDCERIAYMGATSLETITISESVKEIGNKSFSGCTGLTSLAIPSSVTSIGSSAFYGCSGINSITIPSSVTSIGSSAFYGCSGINSITIPSSVNSIGDYAFSGCSLSSVTIPSSVKNFGKCVFQDCTELLTVISYMTEPNTVGYGNQTQMGFSENTYRNGTLYVPAGTKELYLRFDGWKEFLKIVEMAGEEQTYLTILNGEEEIAKLKVKQGENYTWQIPSTDDHKLTSLYFNDALVTNQINQDGIYTTPAITTSSTLKMIYEDNAQKWGDLNRDGVVDVADHVELTKIIMTSVTDPENGDDPNNPSDDNIDTDKVTAHFTGGAYIKVNDCIQSGSKLNVQLSNQSEKTITLTGIYLIDGQTKAESENLFTDSMDIPSGADFGYTITVGANGITQPIVRFTYSYNNKNYTAEDQWKETNTP